MEIVKIKKSSDGKTTKFTQVTCDKHYIETVYVDYHNKHIICYSTQIGCKHGCIMCYNGIMNNFIRNLRSDEIVDQISNVTKYINLKLDKPILFSAMGIGEPLSNYDNYIESVHILDKKYPGNKFALTTVGSNTERIISLASDCKDINLKLTISFHSANNYIRKKLMPSTSSIDEIIKSVKTYKDISDSNVEFNITLIHGVNDFIMSDVFAIYNLFIKYDLLDSVSIKINRFNTISNSNFVGSLIPEEFCKNLNYLNINAEYYETNGSDINAACGQMISK